jgi:hypothetical protein
MVSMVAEEIIFHKQLNENLEEDLLQENYMVGGK